MDEMPILFAHISIFSLIDFSKLFCIYQSVSLTLQNSYLEYPGKQLAKTKQNMEQYSNQFITQFKNQVTLISLIMRYNFYFYLKYPNIFKVYSLLVLFILIDFLIVFCLIMAECQTTIHIGKFTI